MMHACIQELQGRTGRYLEFEAVILGKCNTGVG
jgi:hypothetical protein